MEIAIKNPIGAKSVGNKIDVSEVIFGQDFNESLVHQVVTAYLAGGRSGTKAQKTRSQVRGGGVKPYRQKGTGRARAGTIRSPLWTGGGKVFAAVPRDHSQKVNKKMYQRAMRSILSELIRQERLIVVKDLTISQPKTKELLKTLSDYGLKEALILVNDWDKNLFLAARNVPKVFIREAQKVDPVSLVKYASVVITESALRKIEEVLK